MRIRPTRCPGSTGLAWATCSRRTLVQAGLIGDGYLVEMEAEAVVGG